jgi:acyl-CoA reductase-like NAD-dependent aldehyde dehydrogenase
MLRQAEGTSDLPGVHDQLFIDGEFVAGLEGRTLEVADPHDGSHLATMAEGRAEDIDRAVVAARRAAPGWAGRTAADRGLLLLRLADAIEQHADELALLETRDTGHPLRDTTRLDVPRTAACYRYFGGMADKFQGTVPPVETGFLNYVEHAPVGVVGAVVPWNFPLMFTSWKMGPALAAGNTVVMKPSELTPLSTLRLAELMAEVGFPPGVVNIVPGYGATAGSRLVEHPDVDMVSFTGSTAVGRSVITGSAGNLKRVHLELGGKGANIVFADADLDAALRGSAFAIFHNQGQACIAGSRLLVQEDVADEFIKRFVALAGNIRVGDPKDLATEMGPLTSRTHQERVLAYVDVVRDDGGRILTGGAAPADPALADGCYVEPTVVTARAGDRVTQEEVFGPFLAVSTFRDEADALEQANGVDFGLGAGLWTRDLSRAHRMAGHLRAGMVWVNSYKRINPGSPFGGVGSSGYGREMGFEAMHEYTEPRSVWINVDAPTPAFYGGS